MKKIVRFIKRIVRSIIVWALDDELSSILKQVNDVNSNLIGLDSKYVSLLNHLDVSVDIHEYRKNSSWAVISIEGKKHDYIKFIDLGDSDIWKISKFLRDFEKSNKIKVDASPTTSKFLKYKY